MFKGLHDAEIVLVDSSESRKKLRIGVRDTLGSIREFTFSGCSFFRVEDYTRQNVISHAVCYSGADFVESEAKELLRWVTSFSDSGSYLSEPLFKEALDQIRRSQLTLLGLIPSAGAQVVVVFVEAKETTVK